jgi:hypothetical protein
VLQRVDTKAFAALALIAPESTAALVGQPLLRLAIHRHIAATFALVDGLDDFGFWLSRNRDRVILAGLAAALGTREIGATSAEFVRLAVASGVASRGAALDFLTRARAAGHLVALQPGVAAGNQPVMLRRPLWRVIRRLVRHVYGALATSWPDLAPVARGDRAVLLAFGQYFLMGLMLRNSARSAGAPGPFARPEFMAAYARITPFIDRDIGLRFLFAMIEQQPPDGAHLLDRARLSRRQLAMRLRVSRVHINRLLAETTGAGIVTLPTPDEIRFSPELSQAVEFCLAHTCQVMRALALALAQGVRVDRAGLARIDRIAAAD